MRKNCAKGPNIADYPRESPLRFEDVREMAYMTRSVTFSLASVILLASPPADAASTADHQGFMANHYPPKALANGEQGQVAFSVDVDGGGRIERCAITQGSGYSTLDRET